MPSPFPGMDLYIEGQAWEDFHHGFIEALTARLRPRYVVKVELRVYVEHVLDAVIDIVRPDALIDAPIVVSSYVHHDQAPFPLLPSLPLYSATSNRVLST